MFSSRLTSVLAVSTALWLGVGCSQSATTSQQSAPPPEATGEQPPPRAEIERDCPMVVPGAQARAEDTPEGVALIIVTDAEQQVEALRQRSREMMSRQQEHGVSGRRGLAQPPGIEYQGMGGGGLAGSAGAPSVVSRSRLEEIPGGVSITYTAQKPEEQARLSSDIHENADLMKPGFCPGMAPPEPQQ
ncbi:hypothetical protein HPC49_19010 [Pyxidicoccus fallax]|uniref:Lipoprotein n=1 Tax=Pyxidicoccus fallax TaxID=394095 RepID=A0A848L3W5_9BACT|nr:hypothetical protein [Pyxidicoccus fallax]NMO13394.1 hypothetical protein [Pyxidicoccus fallax]NPC80303.1 hypothetical protein [Pyxidicoccus fallax]